MNSGRPLPQPSERRVFIIGGAGMVGATTAYALTIKEIAHEIILIDVADELVAAQAADINHAAGFSSNVRVRVGSYDEIEADDVVVITCGASLKPGQTRSDLLQVNAIIVRQVVRQVMRQGKPVFILMVTNPIDVMTYVALQESGLPKERVFGTGTALDTARLRVRLANDLHVSQDVVNAYVLGEHGDSSFCALSGAIVAGVPLSESGLDSDIINKLSTDIQQAAYQFIAANKSSYYGIGHTTATIVRAMLQPTGTIHLPVCSYAIGEYGLNDIVISLPSTVDRNGVRIVRDFPLSPMEVQHLHESARQIHDAVSTL